MNTHAKMDKTWEHCIKLYGMDRCIAMCHHGSFNYECDLPESDVDVKLFIAPTWDEVINYKQPLSKTIQGPYGDINVTDIRLFIGNNLKKQNFNFLECLFTKYYCVNPAYTDLWSELIAHREEIAHYKPEEALRTMMGQVENQWKRWGRFDDKKTFYHMARIVRAIESYHIGRPFAKTLVPDDKDFIMRVRLGKVDQESMEKIFKSLYTTAHMYANSEYTGKRYETIDYDLTQLQAQFTYRALYELRCLE